MELGALNEGVGCAERWSSERWTCPRLGDGLRTVVHETKATKKKKKKMMMEIGRIEAQLTLGARAEGVETLCAMVLQEVGRKTGLLEGWKYL